MMSPDPLVDHSSLNPPSVYYLLSAVFFKPYSLNSGLATQIILQNPGGGGKGNQR